MNNQGKRNRAGGKKTHTEYLLRTETTSPSKTGPRFYPRDPWAKTFAALTVYGGFWRGLLGFPLGAAGTELVVFVPPAVGLLCFSSRVLGWPRLASLLLDTTQVISLLRKLSVTCSETEQNSSPHV